MKLQMVREISFFFLLLTIQLKERQPTFLLAPEYELGVGVSDLHDASPLVSDAR